MQTRVSSKLPNITISYPWKTTAMNANSIQFKFLILMVVNTALNETDI